MHSRKMSYSVGGPTPRVAMRPARWLTSLAAAFLTSVALCSAAAEARQDRGTTIETISTHANLVSGGDVLVRITTKRMRGDRNQRPKITLNGRDVSTVFRRGPEPNTLIGLVTGLRPGTNALRVHGNRSSGIGDETLQITNHSISGPIISGPHQTPFVCETSVFGLGAPVDGDCNAPTRVDYFYRS